MIRLVAMSDDAYAEFASRCQQDYAAEVSRVNDLSLEEGLAQAEATFRRLLPDGRPGAPDQYLYTAVDEDSQPVGSIWFGIRRDRRTPYAYIWDIHLAPESRGKGYGEQILRLVEAKVRELGFAHIALNVFGHNAPARKLYERMGYQATAISMGKDLEA